MPNVTADNVTFTPVGGVAQTTITLSSFAVGAGANRMLLVGVSQWKASDTAPSATFNTSETVALFDATTISQSPGTRRVTILRLLNPSNVTANISVSWGGGSVDEAVVGATSWSEVNQTTPLAGTQKASSSGSSTSSVSIPNASGDVVHDVIACDAGGSAQVTANQTQRWRAIAASNTTEGAAQTATGTGSNITCQWSNIFSSGFSVQIGVAIQQSAASADPFFSSTLDTRTPWSRNRERNVGFTQAAQTKLFGKDQFFSAPGQGPDYDWPNPRGYVYPNSLRIFQVSLNQLLIGKDKFFGAPGQVPDHEWPNPRHPQRSRDLLTYLDPSEFWLLKDTFYGEPGQVPTYFIPNPRGYAYPVELRTFLDPINLLLIGKDKFFGGPGQPPQPNDFQNPIRPVHPIELRTWLVNLLETTLAPVQAPQNPFKQTDWPNPRGYPHPVELRTFLGRTNLVLGKDQFFGVAGNPTTDWPNPVRAPFAPGLRTWLYSITTTTLGINPVPFALYDWPNPLTPRHNHQGFLGNQPLTLKGKDTFYGAPGQPPTNYDWPVPKGYPYPRDLRTFFNTEIPPQTPYRSILWQNPRLPVWSVSLLRLDQVASLALLYQVSPLPPGPAEAPDDDWYPSGIGEFPEAPKPPRLSVRTRHGMGTFPLPFPRFQGQGMVVSAGDEEELLLFLLADET